MRHWINRMIRDIRKEAGMTVVDLALASNVHRNSIRTIENGAPQTPFQTIEKLLDALGYELEVMSQDGKTRR